MAIWNSLSVSLLLLLTLKMQVTLSQLDMTTSAADYNNTFTMSVVDADDFGTLTTSEAHLDETDKTPLYLGGLFSLGGRSDESGHVPAVEMALDHINRRSDILMEYDLRMVWNDTQVSDSN